MSNDFRELLIGCGYKPYVKKLASLDGNPHWRGLFTLDQNPECQPDMLVDLNVGPQWAPFEYIRGPWREYLSDDDGCLRESFFDEVHAYEVLEHLGAQGDADAFFMHFSEIWRILKPGGHLYATVPSRFSPWLWGDPSHRRAILPESLVFLNQPAYVAQCDSDRPTGMSDFRSIYHADFNLRTMEDNRNVFVFVLEAVKPSRWVKK